MNLNTETGRLSSRKPNLQNQPALDKDRYKIRKAFVAEKGCKLIVADYGQLELRVLAHMTNCVKMIEAFKLGGDFHSRTALVSSGRLASSIYRACTRISRRRSRKESACLNGTQNKGKHRLLC